MNCEQIKDDQILRLDYTQRALIKYFNTYNQYQDPNFKIKEQYSNSIFKAKVKLGSRLTSFSMGNNYLNVENIDFGTRITPQIGVELEYIFPFNNNRWVILFEPTFQKFKGRVSNISYLNIPSFPLIETDAELNYSSLELPISFRNYFIQNKNSDFFANLGMVLIDIYLDSYVNFENEQARDIDLKGTSEMFKNFMLGIGYQYDKQYSIEARYGFTRDIFRKFTYWSSEYRSFSIVLGYSF